MSALRQFIHSHTQIVLELGSWLGTSAKAMADMMSCGIVVCVDTWCGSPEHRDDPKIAPLLPQLYEQFIVNCWEYRRRIIPVRATTLTGMALLWESGIAPEVVYIDADHSTEAVVHDVETAVGLWPNAQIVADDWNWDTVRGAADQLASTYGWSIRHCGNVWWIEGETEQ